MIGQLAKNRPRFRSAYEILGLVQRFIYSSQIAHFEPEMILLLSVSCIDPN
jgi:hypothetical protein